MRRRDFLCLAAATAVAQNPVEAEADISRIGVVQTGSQQENQDYLVAFRDGLAALGWRDGDNIAVLDRWAEERPERLPGIIKELIGAGVAELVTAGTLATLAAKRATIGCPVDMPPRIPPAWFDKKRGLRSFPIPTPARPR